MDGIDHRIDGEDAGPDGQPDARGRIARLEAEIEDLAHSLERGRKIAVLAQVLMVGGAVWILGGLVGLLRFDVTILLGAVAAVIGGIVLFGSNDSTRKQMEARVQAAEAERAALIGSIGLRVVSGDGSWH